MLPAQSLSYRADGDDRFGASWNASRWVVRPGAASWALRSDVTRSNPTLPDEAGWCWFKI